MAFLFPYQDKVILIGGSNAREHLSRVIGYEWDGNALVQHKYPSLPFPLAKYVRRGA